MRRPRSLASCLLAAALLSSWAPPASAAEAPVLPAADPVVVATFDTGTNPFHPCFRREYWSQEGFTSPRNLVSGYPADASRLDLQMKDSYATSLSASQKALSLVQPGKLYFIPGTNLSFYGGPQAKTELVDNYPHGAQASSQIACEEFGMASNAQLLILNWYDDYGDAMNKLNWVAAQPWIDVIHLNIQDLPNPAARAPAIEAAIDAGKVVVIAAGNGVYGLGPSYPMEISSWNGPHGSLIAGANDNGGWAAYSNLDPHVVMDGVGTVAAAPTTFGTTGFSGTSSASPRITGYVARIIGALRLRFGHTGAGLVTMPEGATRPASGPLADGTLTAAEVHEVVRKTANPNPHDSYYDGSGGIGAVYNVPQPADSPVAVYTKMGYGEVSEHTIGAALDVLTGKTPQPARTEDAFYEVSEELRRTLFPR